MQDATRSSLSAVDLLFIGQVYDQYGYGEVCHSGMLVFSGHELQLQMCGPVHMSVANDGQLVMANAVPEPALNVVIELPHDYTVRFDLPLHQCVNLPALTPACYPWNKNRVQNIVEVRAIPDSPNPLVEGMFFTKLHLGVVEFASDWVRTRYTEPVSRGFTKEDRIRCSTAVTAIAQRILAEEVEMFEYAQRRLARKEAQSANLISLASHQSAQDSAGYDWTPIHRAKHESTGIGCSPVKP